ncbi:hypothetical protein ACWGLG_16050 [Streptomyces antimycoticus]
MSDRIADIKAREQAATPGPWQEHEDYGPNFYAYLGGSHLRGVGTLNFGDGEDAEADRDFTLNARTDVPWLIEQLEQAHAAVAAHVQAEDDIRTLLANKDLPTGPEGAIAWDLGMAVLAHLDFPEPETDDERLAGLRALTEQLRKRNEQQAEQLEQARRIAVRLENENARLTDRITQMEALTSNAQKLVNGWIKSYADHVSVSQLDALRDDPHMAGIQEGRANQYSDCANELRDVLAGEDPDDWTYGISAEVTQEIAS